MNTIAENDDSSSQQHQPLEHDFKTSMAGIAGNVLEWYDKNTSTSSCFSYYCIELQIILNFSVKFVVNPNSANVVLFYQNAQVRFFMLWLLQ